MHCFVITLILYCYLKMHKLLADFKRPANIRAESINQGMNTSWCSRKKAVDTTTAGNNGRKGGYNYARVYMHMCTPA